MNKQITDVNNQDRFFDINGHATKQPITKLKATIIFLGIAVVILCSFLPLQAYGEKAGIAVGLILLYVIYLSFGILSPGPCMSLFVFLAVVFGVTDITVVQEYIGKGMFLLMLGLCIVAVGVESTPLGSRIAFYMLKTFGKNPNAIIYIVTGVSVILSALLSNVAVIILLCSIAQKLLLNMNEKKGYSKFGVALMLGIAAGAQIGGAGLVQGSPGYNLFSLSLLPTVTGQNITYAEWAMIGIPSVLLMIIPASYAYIKSSGFDSKSLITPDKGYYEAELNKLGKIGGSEIRWIITVAAMIILMLMNINSNILMLIFIPISLAPIIGTTSPKEAYSQVPWDIVLSVAFAAILGVAFSSSGLSAFVAEKINPLISGLHPLMFMLIVTTSIAVGSQLIPGAQQGLLVMSITVFGPIAMGMGYNPKIILLPIMFLISWTFGLHAHTVQLCSYSFGWWKPKDCIIPGFVLNVFGSILICLLTYFLAPLFWQTSVYL